MEWREAIELVKPGIVQVSSPGVTGTGFLLSRSADDSLCAVATAAHVVQNAHEWELPIRITHQSSGNSIFLRSFERVILIDVSKDTAAIIFLRSHMQFLNQPLPLLSEDLYIPLGEEIGWLGFPGVTHPNMCFFSGRISSFIESQHAYLVDGVVINGVSGGPAFIPFDSDIHIVGVVSAYLPNRQVGETLPGLSVVRDVSQLQEATRQFRTLEEARRYETEAGNNPPEEVQ